MKIALFCSSFALILLSTVYADEHLQPPAPVFSQLGKGKITEYAGRNIHHHVRADDLESNVALWEEILPPMSLGAPPHQHSHEDEIFVVLEGKVHFLNINEEVIAKAGTIASLPRGYMHGFWNPYQQPARLLVFVSPGHFDKFFEAVEAAMKSNPKATPEQIGAIIGEQAGKMDVKIDMTRLPKSARKLLAPAGNK